MPSCSVNPFLALLFSLAFTAVRSQTQNPCSPCEDVHFFLSRGNNEPYPGRQAALVEATCDGLSSCGYEDLLYSSLYTDEYCQSVYDGSIAGHVQMTAYAERCPDSKLVLTGYSQGAQTALDILGGGGGESFNGCIQPPTPSMDRSTSPGSNIAAVIAFGNTRHTADQPYNYGNGSAISGWYPRDATMLAALLPYANIMRDWCISTDPICAKNASYHSETSHLDYFNVDSAAAAAWIQSVASLTKDSDFTTSIPTSIAGTVQDYATIGTATPSGDVRLDTTWTLSTTAACQVSTTSSYSAGVTASALFNGTTVLSSHTYTPSATSFSKGLPLGAGNSSVAGTTTAAGSAAAPSGSGTSSSASAGSASAGSSVGTNIWLAAFGSVLGLVCML